MNYFMASKKEILADFKSDADKGLTVQQAAENSKTYGNNEFTKEKPQSLLHRLYYIDFPYEPNAVWIKP